MDCVDVVEIQVGGVASCNTGSVTVVPMVLVVLVVRVVAVMVVLVIMG